MLQVRVMSPAPSPGLSPPEAGDRAIRWQTARLRPAARWAAVACGLGRGSAQRSPALRRGWARLTAFTLIELILVMGMLSIVLALAAPALARFFRGRGLDAEARRFVALVRHGQSRAVFEGVPMRLWIDPEQRAYGLEAEPGYLEEGDEKAVVFNLNDQVAVEVEESRLPLTASPWPQASVAWLVTDRRPMVRFGPDGFISETSPEFIVFRQVRDGEEQDAVWIGRTRNRLSYEVHPMPPSWARR